jgi:DNA-binding phage protein
MAQADPIAARARRANADAPGILARTHGMARVAGDSGLARETLYRSLSIGAAKDQGAD